MAGISLDTIHSAGGMLKSKMQDFVEVDGRRVIVVGDDVLPYDFLIHLLPNTMVTGSNFISIEGIPVCFAGDYSSCGHEAEGSDWLIVT